MNEKCRYVSKKEIKEYKIELEDTIPKIKEEIKAKYGKSFNHAIVGSARRNLVVQRKNGIYDVDYQLLLDSPIFNKIDTSELKLFVQKLFKKYLGYKYNVKLSTSVITISSRDQNNRKHFDIALIRTNKENMKEILRGKESNNIRWELVKNSNNKIKEIKGNDWNKLREVFLNKKCSNFENNYLNQKETLSIYFESIKETLDLL
ncbi:hypothetical protein X271_00550 [Candidatus Hepatoplasma crinochetorum Av]|uniref:Nucleotidyltransferase n=1 Tax=Candidatus Hepatoplasma crinochetorum Av TaxID=1427984 RepID=W8GT95_9MOLU|nr:hypothetical protein [Candidatus Hepatoplasma crinochetorum]AHK22650.1 hypothetical protein X271_00550 [Candidatus Hepatoplasma crinochetorum Av]